MKKKFQGKYIFCCKLLVTSGIWGSFLASTLYSCWCKIEELRSTTCDTKKELEPETGNVYKIKAQNQPASWVSEKDRSAVEGLRPGDPPDEQRWTGRGMQGLWAKGAWGAALASHGAWSVLNKSSCVSSATNAIRGNPPGMAHGSLLPGDGALITSTASHLNRTRSGPEFGGKM